MMAHKVSFVSSTSEGIARDKSLKPGRRATRQERSYYKNERRHRQDIRLYCSQFISTGCRRPLSFFVC